MKKLMKSKYFKWGVTAFITIALGICFYYIIFMGKNISAAFSNVIRIIMPVVDGLALAYIFTPVLNWIEQHIVKPLFGRLKKDCNTVKNKRRIRSVSVIITLIFVLFVIYEFFAIIIPQLVQSIQNIIIQSPVYMNNLINLVEKALADHPDLEKTVTSTLDTYSGDVNTWLNKNILPRVNELVRSVSMSIIGILKALYNLIIGFIISIYVMSNKELFAGQSKKMAYALFERSTANHIVNNFRFINKTFIGFLGGKIIDSIIIGLLCFIGTTVLQMPYAVLVSVIVGITNIIPFFGPYIGAIPSTLLILMIDPLKSLYFLIFILILQQIDGNIIGPKILGNSTGLSGFWVIFSITFFGGLWGILGMIVGVPIFAVIYAAVSSIIEHKLEEKDLPMPTQNYLKLDHIDESDDFIMLAKPEDHQEQKTDKENIGLKFGFHKNNKDSNIDMDSASSNKDNLK